MKRIFLENIQSGNNNTQILKAFQLATDICKSDTSIKSLIIYVPTQNNVDHIKAAFGEQFLKDILKGKGISLYSGGPGVRILTDKTIQNCAMTTTVIVATYVSYETLIKADELYECKAIIAIPWLKDELNFWVDTWNPEIIDQQGNLVKQDKIPLTISNPIVQNAIDEFSFSSITHPSDRETFVTNFKILKKNNVAFNTDEISAYLVREKKWTNEDAQEVKELGDKINIGQRVNGGDLTYENEALRRWSE